MTEIARRKRSAEDQALVNQAFEHDQEFRRGLVAQEVVWWRLAEIAWEFHEADGWLKLGHDKLKDWLADLRHPHMTKRHFFRLVQAWREVGKKVPSTALEGVSIWNLDPVLPAITKGDVAIDEALVNVRELGQRDLREKYGEPKEEEPKVQCEHCGSWVAPEKIP